jgi:hypothetical protein
MPRLVKEIYMTFGYKSPIFSPVILVEMEEDGLFSHLGEISSADSLEAMTQEIAVDLFKACMGPSAVNPSQTVFDITLANLILDRLDQVYRPKTKKTASNPHVGYIYVVELPYPMRKMGEDKHILWVGVSEQPWVTFHRASNGLGTPRMVALMREIKKYSQEHMYSNFVWRKEEIVDAYKEGREQSVHSIDSSMLWLPWRIVDDNFAKQMTVQHYLDKFRNEGHPLRNGQPGRPGKSKSAQIEE